MNEIDVLFKLFSRVIIPRAVFTELQQERTPDAVKGLKVAGTLFVLEEAAVRGLISLPAALAKLQQTSFRVTPILIHAVLDRAAARMKKDNL